MAAFVFIVSSIAKDLLSVGNVFVNSGFSIHECWNYLMLTRKEILFQRYLNSLDSLDNQNNTIKSKIKYKKIQLHQNRRKMISSDNDNNNIDTYDFVDIDDYYANIPIETPNMVETEVIQEPGLVYSCATLGELTPGTSFYIVGKILRNCERFSINLTYGNKDIALHINPRLPQNYIVRNSYVNGNWDKEEVTSALPFTLKRGHTFAIQILITESEYFISINGHHFASFKHRIPYNRVRCLQVKGDVTDIEVEQVAILEYPDKLPESETKLIPTIPFWQDDAADIDLNGNVLGQLLELPFYGKLSDKFRLGKCLHILGRVKILPHSFFINLQQGDKIWPHPIIAFHLNPRFGNVGGKHIICRNTWNGKWDKEERSEIYTDFMPSKNFHMTIYCSDSSYNVYLNGKFISEYKFRIDTNIVDTVYIQGDINLKKIVLETSPNIEQQDISNFEDLEELH